MKNILKIALIVGLTAVSGIASSYYTNGCCNNVRVYQTPDPYYPVYYSVDRYTGTHYVREPYYQREPYYRVVRTRPVVWVPSHNTRCCAVSGYWREAPYMSAGGRVWVPAYYGGRQRGWIQSHWVIPD